MSEGLPSFSKTIENYKKIFSFLNKGFHFFLEKNWFRSRFSFDLLLTVFFAFFWLWFGWQYGFQNSPDSWYRGVLGKSIAAGHPYFINLKQGWLYNYGAWHHDATHEPLLPVLYALFFAVFGNRIIIANLISLLSAALFLFPLLRLSRRLFQNNPWPGCLAYLLVVFNKDTAYLFEVLAGLSIPTTLLALAFFILCLERMLATESRGWFWGAVVAIVAFYYNRADSQLVFFLLMPVSLLIGQKMFDSQIFRKLRNLWAVSFILVLPWLIRKFFLFGNPFFSHVSPTLWTDRGYDLWTYHEYLPLPTPASYFANHSWFDFLVKIFVRGTGNVYATFQMAVNGLLWLYLPAFLIAGIIVSYKLTDKKAIFVFICLWTILAGYFGIFSLVPGLEVRYFSPLYFIITLTILTALFLLYQTYLKSRRAYSWLFYLLLIAAVFALQKDLWLNFNRDYLHFNYQTQDHLLQQDPLIYALKYKNLNQQAVILGPFADVQRLSFATGLTFIEEPDNLKNLADPAEFFRKYNIRYSLVDVSRILPTEMIEKMESAGDRILFTINLKGNGIASNEPAFQPSLYGDAEIKKTIRRGVLQRLVFIDAFHADEAPIFSSLREMKLKAFVSYSDFVGNRDKLFQCGLLLMQYGQGKQEISETENMIIKQFIGNGGRILLLCPAWVWVSYEKKGLERLAYQKIAANFGLILTADYVAGPLRAVDPAFLPAPKKPWGGTFSGLIYDRSARPLLVGNDGRAAAVTARRGNARILVWAQNNLFSDPAAATPEGKHFIKRIFDWLFE